MDDHSVSFKESVSLMARQEKLEETGEDVYSVEFSHLVRIP
jgi:hypothetical protein